MHRSDNAFHGRRGGRSRWRHGGADMGRGLVHRAQDLDARAAQEPGQAGGGDGPRMQDDGVGSELLPEPAILRGVRFQNNSRELVIALDGRAVPRLLSSPQNIEVAF